MQTHPGKHVAEIHREDALGGYTIADEVGMGWDGQRGASDKCDTLHASLHCIACHMHDVVHDVRELMSSS